MDITDRVREYLSPHLARLSEIDQLAEHDAEAGLEHLSRFIADLIRDAAPSELREVIARLDSIETKLERIMTEQSQNQAQIDTDVAGIEDALGAINTAEQANGAAVAAVAAAFAAFQAAQTPDNLAALDQAVTDAQAAAAGVSSGVSAVQALVPGAPAPAPSGDGTGDGSAPSA